MIHCSAPWAPGQHWAIGPYWLLSLFLNMLIISANDLPIFGPEQEGPNLSTNRFMPPSLSTTSFQKRGGVLDGVERDLGG